MLKENTKGVAKKVIEWFKSLKWYFKVSIVVILFGVINNISDILKSPNETVVEQETTIDKRAVYTIFKRIVQPSLENPETAKFPEKYISCEDLGGNSFLIKSYVDYEKSFGDKFRHTRTLLLKYKGNNEDSYYDPKNWTVLSEN